ncbi:hypothetical protein [Enteractinococcus fodinae]|uniref:Lipoprotein n=1 Tax=Enteractinococcus fodinae TaxID=684663 RepID=A0ABU2AZS7_9MICC|nr:hypothetical protein [Enteractinococcus fodinae]MDR7346279.1 hypothetical protein [Enteractinococcus fodinae]
MMFVKRQALRIAALTAVGGMFLAGCTSQDADQPTETPTDEDVATASPTAPEVDLDQYAEALVTDRELVGIAHDPPVEGFIDDPVTMYLTLSEFNPSGSCARLLEELNSFTAPAVGGVAAKFMRGAPAANDGDEDETQSGAAVETMIFETVEAIEPMAIYRDIPNACETLSSTEVEGAEATFTKVPGLDAMLLEISDGEDVESLAVGGSSVNAQFHMYMTAEQVTLEQAQEMFGAQAEKLQQTFQDQVDETAPSPTASPTDAATSADPEEPTDDAS